MGGRILAWFSAGAPSAVATKLAIAAYGDAVVPVRIETGAEHPDNDRFAAACETWFGRPLEVIKSTEYADTWDVWERTGWIAGIKGARCTSELKIAVRHDFQQPDDVHVFGYTADRNDVDRAARLRQQHFELTVETPLIERGLTKAACLAIVQNAGIEPPVTYAIGLPNANCIPCPKATSPNYYALIRKEFPDEFARLAELSRRKGVRLCRIHGERRFIDEIPAGWPTTQPTVAACDFLCAAVSEDLE